MPALDHRAACGAGDGPCRQRDRRQRHHHLQRGRRGDEHGGDRQAATTAVATIYFVGDQNPAVTVTASAAQGCLPTPPGLGLPKGYLCTVPIVTPVTSIVENLGDGNDTGVIRTDASGPNGTINGGTDDDTLVGGRENDTFHGNGGTDNVAYVGIAAAGITRTVPVTAALPGGASPSTGNGQAGENDAIAADVEDLTGGNGNDTLTGNAGPNTIAGSAPPGTPDVDPQPAGTESRDIINGAGGDDTLLAGDSGTVAGNEGNDTVVGGRSFANVTTVVGGPDDDTLVSGRGSDNISGGGGSNTLAYVSVSQGGLQIVNRGQRRPRPASRARGDRHRRDDRRPGEGRHPRRPPDPDRLQQRRLPDRQRSGRHDPRGRPGGHRQRGRRHAGGQRHRSSAAAATTRWSAATAGPWAAARANDTLVGGRSTAASDRTVIHGDPGDDTIVSGLGNDEIFGDAGVQHARLRLRQPERADHRQSRPAASSSGFPNPGRPARAGRSAARRRTSSMTTSGP